MIENVGKANNRNIEYYQKFNKEKILKKNIQKRNPVCFDVGAYQGQSVEFFKNIFDKPLIYSFEPLPKNFKVLKNKKYNDNICFNFAISNFIGDAIFFENKISHTSSLFKVNKNSRDSIRINQINELENFSLDYNKKINVKVTTLDEIFKSENLSEIDLLKIDVQGAESLVIDGGRNQFLDNTKAIMIEVSLYDYYDNNNNIYDIEKYIIPKGFRLNSILDISQNPMNGRTDWVELFYIREI